MGHVPRVEHRHSPDPRDGPGSSLLQIRGHFLSTTVIPTTKEAGTKETKPSAPGENVQRLRFWYKYRVIFHKCKC